MNKNINYKTYKDTNYIVLSDGTMARVLKQVKIHNQTYFNPIIDGKLKRINKLDLLKFVQDNGLHS